MKMVLARSAIKRKKRYVKLLYWILNRWRVRMKFQKFMKKLKLTREQLRKCGKARYIQKHWRNFKSYVALKGSVISRLQCNYRMIRVQNVSYITALKLRLDNPNNPNATLTLGDDEESERDIFAFKKASRRGSITESM